MSLVVDTLSWIALIGGGIFLIIAGIGVLRLPDFFSRVHAVGIMDTLGAALIMLGLLLQSGWSLASIKLVLILAFLLITGPTATHALARAALHGNYQPPVDTEREKQQ